METINHLSLNSSESLNLWQVGKPAVLFIKSFFFSFRSLFPLSITPPGPSIYNYLSAESLNTLTGRHSHHVFKSPLTLCLVFSIFIQRLIKLWLRHVSEPVEEYECVLLLFSVFVSPWVSIFKMERELDFFCVVKLFHIPVWRLTNGCGWKILQCTVALGRKRFENVQNIWKDIQ